MNYERNLQLINSALLEKLPEDIAMLDFSFSVRMLKRAVAAEAIFSSSCLLFELK